MERISRKGQEPCYQPQITREACHLLYLMGQRWQVPMTVAIDAIIREAHERMTMVEEMLREEALAESGYCPTVFISRHGEYEPVLPATREEAII